MNHTECGQGGLEGLAQALCVNRTLTSLGLGNNNLGNGGAMYLGQALAINSSLTSLTCNDNSFTRPAAHQFNKALASNRTLTVFDLRRNELDDDAVHAEIVQKVVRNADLRTGGDGEPRDVKDPAIVAAMTHPYELPTGSFKQYVPKNQTGRYEGGDREVTLLTAPTLSGYKQNVVTTAAAPKFAPDERVAGERGSLLKHAVQQGWSPGNTLANAAFPPQVRQMLGRAHLAESSHAPDLEGKIQNIAALLEPGLDEEEAPGSPGSDEEEGLDSLLGTVDTAFFMGAVDDDDADEEPEPA